MKEIILNIDGKEIKATVSEEELEKLTKKEEKEWPQRGDKYWYLYEHGIKDVDRARREVGNMYRTKQEAENAIRAQKLIAAIAKRRKELNGDWKPNWEDSWAKQQIVFWEGEISVDTVYSSIIASPFGVYKTVTSAVTIIDEFEDELTWYFTEYTVSVN